MSVSRRKFLKLLAAAVAGGTGGYGTIQYLGSRFPDRVWALNNWLTSPALEDDPTGPVDNRVVQTLLAAVQALVDAPPDTSHYQDFFRWRSQNLPGYKRLYEQFTTTANEAARNSAGCDFADCQPAKRYEILKKAFQVRAATGRLERIRAGIFDRDWVLFDRYIVREIFSLFARTNALVLLGYEAWPGTPRGLDGYRQPPPGLG